ncbi:MAG: hypothetical protein HY909_11610 [Deltaproteobacteria bacterium]|nr:hypothetical protein [Deltaproteobacteria bacterium]
MSRAEPTSSRWPRRLVFALAGSLALHLAVLSVRLRPPRVELPLRIQHSVEFGLEEARRAPPTPAPARTTLNPERPPRPAPRPRAPLPALAALREPPSLRLRPPALLRPSAEGSIAFRARDAGADGAALASRDAAVDASAVALADAGRDGSALALADAGAPDVLLASADAGATDALLAEADAAGFPALASAAGDLAAGVPAGTLVTLYVRTEALRNNPNGSRAREVLLAIPDWQEVLGGTELDPLVDFDDLLLASPDPTWQQGRGPDLVVLVHTRAPHGFLRASIEQMAGARGPYDADAGTLRAHFGAEDAGALAAPSRPVWNRRNGTEVATVDRYGGPRSVVLLGDDLAAIAQPGRLPAVLAALGQRPPRASRGPEERLVLRLEADAVRRMVQTFPEFRFLVPTRLELALYALHGADGLPDGGATLDAYCTYPSNDEAVDAGQRGMAMLEATLALYERNVIYRAFANFPMLRAIVRGLSVRAEGSVLHLRGDLSRAQVAELLRLQRLGAMLAAGP